MNEAIWQFPSLNSVIAKLSVIDLQFSNFNFYTLVSIYLGVVLLHIAKK